MMHALFLKHKALPGRRDELEAVWQRHMRPAVAANDGHVAYLYGFGAETDVVGAFQVYGSKDEADAFLKTPAYRAYLEESRPLLAHDPEVIVLSPRWTKGIG